MDELIRQALTVLRGMWKRRWLGVVVAWVVGAASVAAVLAIPDKYEASARMVSLHDLRYHARVSRFDTIIVGATAFSALAISIEFCVLIGTLLSFVLTVPRAAHMRLTEFFVDTDGSIVERLAEDDACPRIRIYGFDGEFCFAAVSHLERFFDRIEADIRPETAVLVRGESLHSAYQHE